MANKITIDGEYAYRKEPETQARVLCIDRPQYFPVVSLSYNGMVYFHDRHGKSEGARGYDLIPLQRKPRVFWMNVYEDGHNTAYSTDVLARKLSVGGLIKTIKVVEVLDDD